jgi:hypothetical protein
MDAPPRKRRCLTSSSDGGDAAEEDHAIIEVLSDEELRSFTPCTPAFLFFILF